MRDWSSYRSIEINELFKMLCGLIGLMIGIVIGLAIDFYYKSFKRIKTIKKNMADIVLLVKCEQKMVEEILATTMH